MSNNFFIEGPIQTGKSTLIRKILGDDLKFCGGFTSQRVLDHKGNTFGFRLVPSDSGSTSKELSSLLKDQCLYTDSPTLDDMIAMGFFKYDSGNGNFRTDISVFEGMGIDCLRLRPDQKLLLIDEIGGVELASEKFREFLFDVLQSDAPCIGVIKLRENMERIKTSTEDERQSLHRAYDDLRRAIGSGSNSSISYYDRIEDSLQAADQRIIDDMTRFIKDLTDRL